MIGDVRRRLTKRHEKKITRGRQNDQSRLKPKKDV